MSSMRKLDVLDAMIASGDTQYNRQQDQTNASLLSMGGGTRRGKHLGVARLVVIHRQRKRHQHRAEARGRKQRCDHRAEERAVVDQQHMPILDVEGQGHSITFALSHNARNWLYLMESNIVINIIIQVNSK